jgi:hypothetical protein
MKRHENLLFGEKGLVHGRYVLPSIRTDSLHVVQFRKA